MKLDAIKRMILNAFAADIRANRPPQEYVLVIPYTEEPQFWHDLGPSELGNWDPARERFMDCSLAFTRRGKLEVYGRTK